MSDKKRRKLDSKKPIEAPVDRFKPPASFVKTDAGELLVDLADVDDEEQELFLIEVPQELSAASFHNSSVSFSDGHGSIEEDGRSYNVDFSTSAPNLQQMLNLFPTPDGSFRPGRQFAGFLRVTESIDPPPISRKHIIKRTRVSQLEDLKVRNAIFGTTEEARAAGLPDKPADSSTQDKAAHSKKKSTSTHKSTPKKKSKSSKHRDE
eukprot:GILK01006192.1.p1 GENE.GILK01006192.1~~GILK01006192.1.p1  ORF type:complete len:222 (-),score=29.48 GILK01006192.1:96-716(-)